MTIKQLEKANKYLEQVKGLDSEIIEIEKHAMLIAEGETKISLSLSVIDLKKKTEEENKVRFDEDGSLVLGEDSISRMMRQSLLSFTYSPFGGLGAEKKKEDKHEQKYSATIEENAALQILGVLLYVKQNERNELLKKIEKIGVRI